MIRTIRFTVSSKWPSPIIPNKGPLLETSHLIVFFCGSSVVGAEKLIGGGGGRLIFIYLCSQTTLKTIDFKRN
jgi:hypothetical protein